MLHLLKIEEIKHIDCDGEVLWEDHDIYNIFHQDGQHFVVQACFKTGSGVVVPSSYYLGLDNRASLLASDTLLSLNGEPNSSGYTRQAVSSVSGFDLSQDGNSNWKAVTNVVTFSASGGGWGPVQNLFLATSSNSVGYLISSAAMASSRTLTSGQAITMRISLGLVNC